MSRVDAGFRWVSCLPPAPGARVLHINTSSTGGGVAEIIAAVMDRDAEVGHASGWAVLEGPPEFYGFTKRLHHLFHGRGSSESLVGPGAVYRDVHRRAQALLLPMIRPHDVVVLHDPQTLGLATWLRHAARRVYWHCHIGSPDDPRRVKPALWSFFENDLCDLDAALVVDRRYLAGSAVTDVREVAPAISPRSPKNVVLSTAQVDAHLKELGLNRSAPVSSSASRTWQAAPLPDGAPVVLQVARWDPLKGMAPVLQLAPAMHERSHLVLAGSDPTEVLDDPEGARELDAVIEAFWQLPARVRDRVHIVALSGADKRLNALRVNALQRRADVVVQRSVEEGFGLTVTEAMLKAKPVVVNRVGGLARQVVPGENGLVVDPDDDVGFVGAVNALLDDARLRERLGTAAQRSAQQRYLLDRLVADYASLLD